MQPFRTHRMVEFADTDMAGIVHFARYFVFMETAEHELLRSCGFEVHFSHEGRNLGWPRGTANCRYHSPARLGDRLDLEVAVRRRGRSSVTYQVEIGCEGRRIADGEITTVCCVVDGPEGLASHPIPPALAARLDEYLLPDAPRPAEEAVGS